MNLMKKTGRTTKTVVRSMTILAAITLIMLTSCKNNQTKTEPVKQSEATNSMTFYVGTYTDGDSEGIYKYELSGDGKLSKVGLVAKTSNPSYLSFNKDKSILLAVNENDSGTVQSFSIKNDSLNLLSESPSGGAHPCQIAINEDGFVLASNYSSGNVGLLQLDGQGKLSELLDLDQHSGKGSTDRQKGPHAHFSAFLPKDNKIIEVDLGTNQLWFATLDASAKKLVPATPRTLDMPEGTGPRHLAFHPNKPLMYVLDELSSSITSINLEGDNLRIMDSFSMLPADYSEYNTGAELKVTKDGKFLYASNRGLNSIAIFKVNNDGSLELLKNTPTKGEMPRNFGLSRNDDFLVVANQDSNSLVAFKRDTKSGDLTYTSEIDAPKPVFVLFE